MRSLGNAAVQHVRAALRTVLGVLRQASHHAGREGPQSSRQRFRRVVVDLVLDLSPAERRRALQALVRHRREGVDVLLLRRNRAVQLLRRHVEQRAAGKRACHPRQRLLHLAGYAEVKYERMAVLADHHVGRFHVPVHNPLAVRVVERGGNRAQDADGLGLGKAACPVREIVVQRLALHVVHHEERVAVVLLERAQGDDVLVRKLDRDERLFLYLAERPLVGHQYRRKRLDREPLVVQLDVLDQPHAAHAALAQVAHDPVAPRKQRAFAKSHRRHPVEGVILVIHATHPRLHFLPQQQSRFALWNSTPVSLAG